MLHLNDLTFRIEGKLILDSATAGIPTGHKVGLVGRNGAGKSTLLKLVAGILHPDDGSITVPRNARIGYVEQEAPGGPESLIDWVLAADKERSSLLTEAETATDPARIAEIQLRLTDIDAHAAPARAAAILAGLGFSEAQQRRPCREFSGGWRMRVALAAVLFLEPEILLLDEPTNYLDLEGTLWLETYLKTYPHTVVIVSHDRDLLNHVPGAILHLDRGKLTLYSGGYDDFEETRRERQRLELKLKKKQDDERRRIQAFIDRFKAKATKARQAQSRVKALAKLKPIAAQVEDRVPPIVLPKPEKIQASPLLRLEGVAAGYGTAPPVLSNLDLRIDQDDRIALLGQNGNGKSTFAKLIAGRLEPQAGKIYGAHRVSVGFFAQHQLDDLDAFRSPYDYIATLMPDATEAQKRTKLGTLGFGAEKADTKCANLSGGEKARLLLAITTFHAPNLLILDEPTNHLDIDSREALIHALAEYEGAVILISHDRHLVEATADRLWLVQNGTVTPYDGDMESYRAQLLSERSGASGRPRNAGDGQTGKTSNGDRSPDRSELRRRAALRREKLAPLKKAIQNHEAAIQKISDALERLDSELADPKAYDDPARAQKMSIERGRLARQLAEAEEQWLAASAAYEDAELEVGLEDASETIARSTGGRLQ